MMEVIESQRNLTIHMVAAETNAMEVNLYITGNVSETAVLYLTDVFGINLTENRL